MQSRRPELGDERNNSFGLGRAAEHIKPGLHIPERKPGKARKGGAAAEDEGHRLEPAEHDSIPRESLAQRIRKSRKGG